MAEKVIIKHYPHQCKIYRREGATSFNPEGKLVIIYEGLCHKEISSNTRTFGTGSMSVGKVDTMDYRVSMPGIVKGIQKGDLIDVTDLIGTETEMRIVFFDATEMPQYEFDENGNKYKIGDGGTIVICSNASN